MNEQRPGPNDDAAMIPPGFRPLDLAGGYNRHNGPLYIRDDGEHLALGFRVLDRHTNPANSCHGAMLMFLADLQLPLGARHQAKLEIQFLPTVSLTTDYLAPAPLGSWVEGRTEVMRVTRNLIFTQGVITADGEPVVRTNGIFKRSSRPVPGHGLPIE
ncbi:PaaI family thioesterase [Oceanibacterium hippocampi]|uniref:Thioesterase superfamily protein n=1 Tax=Oceanibacterium hippocampi TaxID=745714 RepID=A0A1Y5TYJ7_9PROT|nr:PaaI family thioesterase [Oceanibacterium hippocampi]SLN76721.1 Thioesterase superfamily protein [Oceanibacterium hippocampi]